MDLKNLVIADIISKRFKKIISEQKPDIEEFAKKLKFDWYAPRYDVAYHSDGTSTSNPRNNLARFLSGENLYLPTKDQLEHLEQKLGQKQHSIASHLKTDLAGNGISTENFLFAFGYLTKDGRPTFKFNRSARVRSYRKMLEQEARDLKQRREEASKEALKNKQKKDRNLLERLKKFAGFYTWPEKEEAE